MKALHVTCVAVLVALTWWGGPRSRTAEQPAGAAPRCRVGLVNMTFVLRNFEKFAAAQKELQELVKPFQEREKNLRKEAEELTGKLKNSELPAGQRDEIQKKLKSLQEVHAVNEKEARATLEAKSASQMTELFGDVQKSAQRYAAAHDLELVLQYNEALTEKDRLSTANINRKLQNGACLPLYAAPGLDISKDIVDDLNRPRRPGSSDKADNKKG
jgi:Skp family chaperone for outer membrane proteins